MSYNEDYQKEQARRIARGEPLTNEEVLKNMDTAKQHILERGSANDAEPLAKDVAHLVDQGKIFVKEKNPNQELQKLQHAGKRLAKNAPTTGHAQQKYFEQMQERYDDLAELASRMVYSRGTRRIIRRAQTILLEALSSAAGHVEEKAQASARQIGQSSGLSEHGDQHTGEHQRKGTEYGDSSTWHTGYSHHPTGQTDYSGQSTGQGDYSGQSTGQGDYSGQSTGQGDYSTGQTGFGEGQIGQSALSNLFPEQSGQTQFGGQSTGEAYSGQQSGQTGFGDLSSGVGFTGEYKDRPIDEPSALSGPDSFGYGVHEPHTEGASMEGFEHGSGSHDFQQQDTMHTRKNYKVVLRGQEYNFLKDDISDESKDWIAEEVQNICIDISSDDNLKESASAFVRILKSASQINIEKPELNQEATKALEDSKNNLRSLLDNLAEGYDFDRLEKAWDRFMEKTKRNDELERDWKDFFGFLKESFLSKRLSMSHDWKNNFTCKLDCLREHLMSLKPELFNLLQEFDVMMQALKDDKFFAETSQSVDKISKDLFLDKDGKFEFKPEALKQIRDVLAPEVFEQFKFIAIPTFRDEDDTQSSEISNAVFKSEGLTPDDILIQNTTVPKEQLRNRRMKTNLQEASLEEGWGREEMDLGRPSCSTPVNVSISPPNDRTD